MVSLNFFCEVTHTNAKRIRGFYMESLWKKELNHSGENRYAVQPKTENTHPDVIIIGPKKAHAESLVKLASLAKMTSKSPEQPSNAYSPIWVMRCGIEIRARLEQPLKV